jgi:hypothetical protein
MRAGLGLLCLSSLVTGGWAFFAPRSFYGDFPGAGATWVSLLPPFNEHLTTDVGGFYLAFALLLAWSAITLVRPLVVATLVAFLLATVLHTGYHVTHLEGYSTADKVGQTLAFVVLIVLAGALLVSALRRGPRAPAG